MSITHVGRDATYHGLVGDDEHVVETIRSRGGHAFDPAVAQAFVDHAPDILGSHDRESVWEGAIEGLRELAQASPVEVRVVGYGPMPFVEIEDASQRQTFFAYAAEHGLLLHPDHQWFVSAAHTERDIACTLEICAAAFDAAATTPLG